MKPESKYRGAIALSAVGDALGWITEFEKSSSEIKKKYSLTKVESFLDWSKNVGGRFWGYRDSIAAGSYSDDTQLMLAVARSIKPDGSVDQERFSKNELPCWLMYARGGGRTVKQAAEKIQRKSAKWNANFFSYMVKGKKLDYRESGANGAAMRVIPIALASLGDESKTFQNVLASSIVTHGHPRAIIGALLYSYAAQQFLIRRSEDFEPLNLVTQLGKDLQKRFSLDSLTTPPVQQWIKKWDKGQMEGFSSVYSKTLDETQSQLRLVYQGVRDNSEDQELLRKLGCFDPATKGSGLATVNAAIFLACKHFKDPEMAVVNAVNLLGSDTDSIASFAGGMLGGLHGLSCLPERWKGVQNYNYLVNIADRMLRISEGSQSSDPFILDGQDAKSVDKLEDTFKTGERVVSKALGTGKIVDIRRQNTLSKGKYNLLLEIVFDSGQSCIFNGLFDLVL